MFWTWVGIVAAAGGGALFTMIDWRRALGLAPFRFQCCVCDGHTSQPPHLTDDFLYRSVCVDCVEDPKFQPIPIELVSPDELRSVRKVQP